MFESLTVFKRWPGSVFRSHSAQLTAGNPRCSVMARALPHKPQATRLVAMLLNGEALDAPIHAFKKSQRGDRSKSACAPG